MLDRDLKKRVDIKGVLDHAWFQVEDGSGSEVEGEKNEVTILEN